MLGSLATIALVLIAAPLSAPALAAQGPITVRGTVRMGDGASVQHVDLGRTVVFLEAHPSLDGQKPRGPRPQIAQRNKAFIPDLLVVSQGTSVEFPNWDPFSHNVFSRSAVASFDLDRYPRGESKNYEFREAGIVQIFCNIHPQMKAIVVVVPNEHYARADAQGQFALQDVPPGQFSLVAWHELAGSGRQPIEVRPGMAGDIALTVQPQLQQPQQRSLTDSRRGGRKAGGVERGLGIKRERLGLPVVNESHPAPR